MKTETGLAAVRAAAETAATAGAQPAADETVKPAAAAAAAAPAPSAADERARIGVIINSPEAKGREGLAQYLAFNSDMGVDAAVAMLKAAPVAAAAEPAKAGSRLDQVMVNFQPKLEAEDTSEGNSAAKLSAGLHGAVVDALARQGKQPKGKRAA